MPVQYVGIKAEHRAVREAAGLFDVSHMAEIRVNGPSARAFLERLISNRIPTAAGRAVYGLLCQEDGGVIDDLITYVLGDEAFLIVANASNRDAVVSWLQAQAATAAGVAVEDVSDDFSLLAVQGPRAIEIVQSLVDEPLATLKRFHHRAVTLSTAQGPTEVRLSRTGYTGEDGLEIFCSPGDSAALADALMVAGKPLGLVPAGLGCRDSLRLEAGYPLYGHELSRTINPIEAGLGWAVKWDKPVPFVGQAALAAHLPTPARCVVHFVLEGPRIARQDTPVLATDRVVGQVLSGTLSPMLEQPIGSALVDATALAADTPLEVDLRGHRARMLIRKAPLWKTGV